MKPYFYKIKEITTGRYYVGVQYGKKANPDNLWVSYYTSNAYIISQPKQNFNIIKIIQREDAREYERKYLQKCYNLMGREKFLQIMINRNLAPGILNTPESIQKANVKRRVSNRVAALKLLQEGKHNFQIKRHTPTAKEREAAASRMKGNTLGKLRKITDEYRQQAAIKSQGNTNVRGKGWWNNGKQRKRSQSSPGPEWKPGYKIKEA